MIHVEVDTPSHGKVVRYEVGTRRQFDAKHAGDPSWVFVDSNKLRSKVNVQNFLTYPFNYKVDIYGSLFLSDEPPIVITPRLPNPPPGYDSLQGRDGRYLEGEDGQYLYGRAPGYNSPPPGKVWVTDGDRHFLQDQDDKYISEPQ